MPRPISAKDRQAQFGGWNVSFAAVAGISLFVIATLSLWQVTIIPSSTAQDGLGPRALPAIAAAFLLLLAVGFTQAAYKGRCPDVVDDPEQAPVAGGLRRCAWLVCGLLVLMWLLPWFGIGVACMAAFVLFARAFDSRRIARDVVIGAVFVLAVWLLFDRLLGVQLGPFLKLPF